jgi:HK97 family phage portal protein
MSIWQAITEKLNPAQPLIAQDEGTAVGTTQTKLASLRNAYELVEIVNRCVNLLVDNSALVGFDVGKTLPFTGKYPSTKAVTITNLLNFRPNPYMDTSTFRRLVLMDFIIDGNAFIHFDGTSLYHIPANLMEIVPDSKGYINKYIYNGTVDYAQKDVIFIKDNSTRSVYRGDSRITSAMASLLTRESMVDFQKKFFDNGASVGLVIETEQILSKKFKERQEREWVVKFNPKRGRGKPLILDGGMKVSSTGSSDFKEMDFTDSVNHLEDKICVALGIPPILLKSGSNANLKPNIELLFYTTILPMLRKFESAMEFFFAYDIELTTHRVPSLLPDLKAQADRVSSLVNNGIITGDEGRLILRYEPIGTKLMTEIRVPQNIAGSGTGVSGQEGGKPAAGED